VVGSQNWQTPGSSTPGPSFGHNLCFRCPNEQCEPVLDIYASRAFHWYKERNKTLRFDPSNRSLKFWESTETPSPNLGVALGVWRLTPSHSPTLLGVSDVTPGLLLARTLATPFALVASPKLGLRHFWEDLTWIIPMKLLEKSSLHFDFDSSWQDLNLWPSIPSLTSLYFGVILPKFKLMEKGTWANTSVAICMCIISLASLTFVGD